MRCVDVDDGGEGRRAEGMSESRHHSMPKCHVTVYFFGPHVRHPPRQVAMATRTLILPRERMMRYKPRRLSRQVRSILHSSRCQVDHYVPAGAG